MNAAPLLLTFTSTGSRGSLVALSDYFNGCLWPIYPEEKDLADSVRRFFAGFEGKAEDKAAAVAEGLAALRDNGNTEP